MPDPVNTRPGESGRFGTQRSDHGRPSSGAGPAGDAFGRQESGGSGGPAPTSDELAGHGPGEDAGEAAARAAADPLSLRHGEAGDSSTRAQDNADQNKVQGTADNDSDHEAGDQSQGAAKRMD